MATGPETSAEPAYAVAWSPPWGAVGLASAFALFPYTLKKPVERWLFHDEPGDENESGRDDSSQ